MNRLTQRFDHCHRGIRQAISTWASAVLNFVYPPECQLCGAEIEGIGPVFCETCIQQLKPSLTNECPRCGAPAGDFAELSQGCPQCRKESFAFERVIRLGIYGDQMRLACLRAKGAGGSSLTRGLADVLVDQKRPIFDQFPLDLVVPVPEHWSRRFLHPHYAAEILSRQIGHRLGVPWSRSVLIKQRRTPKQATSPTPRRRQQQQGSFAVKQNKDLAGKTILLVDDILTTGATADAAARTLKLAGTQRVIVAVIAVSPLRS